RGDDPEVARRQLGRVGGRARPPEDLPGTRQPQTVAVGRVDVLAREVVRPHLDVAERREVRREQRTYGAAADDTDSDRQLASFAFTKRYMVSCSGTGTPSRRASRTSEPVIMSTSVGRF